MQVHAKAAKKYNAKNRKGKKFSLQRPAFLDVLSTFRSKRHFPPASQQFPLKKGFMGSQKKETLYETNQKLTKRADSRKAS